MRSKAQRSMLSRVVCVAKAIVVNRGGRAGARREADASRRRLRRLEKLAAMTSALAALLSAATALLVAVGHMHAAQVRIRALAMDGQSPRSVTAAAGHRPGAIRG